MNELLECYKMLEDIFNRFEQVKAEMKDIINNQKSRYKTGALYASLHYCSKKNTGCLYCPHHFEWRMRISKEKADTEGEGKFRSIRVATKKITHADLRKIDKDRLYPMLKELENKLRPLQEERDFLAKKIRQIQTILKATSKKI